MNPAEVARAEAVLTEALAALYQAYLDDDATKYQIDAERAAGLHKFLGADLSGAVAINRDTWDSLPEEVQEAMVDHVPGSDGWDHVRLPAAGHFLQDDQGPDIARRVNEFVALTAED